MKLQPKEAPKKEERVVNLGDPIQQAIHFGDWSTIAHQPKKKCKECYGRGTLGYNTVSKNYAVCKCVTIPKERKS